MTRGNSDPSPHPKLVEVTDYLPRGPGISGMGSHLRQKGPRFPANPERSGHWPLATALGKGRLKTSQNVPEPCETLKRLTAVYFYKVASEWKQ